MVLLKLERMIRKYSNKDKPRVIELLQLNTPDYFNVSEEKEFENYLDHNIEDYFVFEINSEIIGAGGINYFLTEKFARISWDIIHPKSQGKGVGKSLIQFRLNQLKNHPEIETIQVRTSQLVYKFYEKMGFELVKVEKDYWAKNLHLYQMKMNSFS